MLRWTIIAIALGVSSPAFAAACAPKDMFRAVVVNEQPGASGATTSAPRTVHRLGSLFARIEEGIDGANRMRRLTVIREPDVWTANQMDGTGVHLLDPGPVFEVRAPLFQFKDMPPLFQTLEMGCELEFIDAYAPKPQEKVKVGGAALLKHQLALGDQRIELLVRPPAAKGAYRKIYSATYFANEQAIGTVKYLTYDVGMPANMTLFEQPPRIKFSEGAPVVPAR